jgi:hypothetical protein
MTGEKPDPESHYFSVVASNKQASYVWPTGKDSTGLDDARIDMLVGIYGKPKNVDEWARLALTNIGSYTHVERIDGTLFEYGKSPKDFADAVKDERNILDHIAERK